jgi:hypothetical protein
MQFSRSEESDNTDSKLQPAGAQSVRLDVPNPNASIPFNSSQ